jgi:serine/threonine-protein kinase
MARIHVGHRRSDRRRVAIKVFLPPAGAERKFLDYMVHEETALRVAASPPVVSLVDSGLWLGRPALVLEWLEGRTLREIMMATGPLPIPRIEQITRQLLRAVATLHDRSVIHADLTAENIMLCPHESGERVRLLDLGAANINGLAAVERDEVVGTPGYVAPELIDGGRVTPQTDVYAIGVLLFEMLTGRPPFTGSELIDVMYQQMRGRIPRPSALRGANEISEALDALVATALAPLPVRRFADVALMRTAFEEAILITARSCIPGEAIEEPTVRGWRLRNAVPSAR